MKYLPLVWAALLRKPAEAILICLAVTAAFTLFGSMLGLRATYDRIIASSRMDRLEVDTRFPVTNGLRLPIAMREQIARIDGVSGVGSLYLLRGYFQDPHNTLRVGAVDAGMQVTAERQLDYYQRVANKYSAFFTKLAYIVGAVMALGALFGSVKIMHTAVSARTREIGTLRALGYRPLPTALALVLEMILLSLTGACLEAGIAWLLFDGKTMSSLADAFDLSVSPKLFLLGLEWAVALAVISALRAARLSVVKGLA